MNNLEEMQQQKALLEAQLANMGTQKALMEAQLRVSLTQMSKRSENISAQIAKLDADILALTPE